MSESSVRISPRQGLMMFRRSWWLILTPAAVLTGLVMAHLSLTDPSYKAKASVVILRTKPALELDPRFKTLSSEEVRSLDQQAKREALRELATSGGVASRVLEQLGDRLSVSVTEAALLRKIKAELPSRSDVIQITAGSENPQLAADIANAWAAAFEKQVNETYRNVPQSFFDSVHQEYVKSRQSYEQAQDELEQFLADNRSSRLERQIAQKEAMIEQLSLSQQARAGVFDSQARAARQRLDTYQLLDLRVEQLLDQARRMRKQVQAGGASAEQSNQAALRLLKVRAFALGSAARPPGEQNAPQTAFAIYLNKNDKETPDVRVERAGSESAPAPVDDMAAELVVDLSSLESTGDPEAQAADLAALVEVLEHQRSRLREQIRLAADELVSGRGLVSETGAAGEGGAAGVSEQALQTGPYEPLIAELETQTQALTRELEQEQAKERELTETRKLAWETYLTLARKETEMGIATSVSGSEVRFAAPAVVPDRPSGQPLLLTGFAGFGGLMLGLSGAFIREYA
ncbi:MAG: hypothetical protein ACOCTI_06355 [Phycisphaeraceae bacterium]